MADLKAVYAAVDEQTAMNVFGERWDKKQPQDFPILVGQLGQPEHLLQVSPGGSAAPNHLCLAFDLRKYWVKLQQCHLKTHLFPLKKRFFNVLKNAESQASSCEEVWFCCTLFGNCAGVFN